MGGVQSDICKCGGVAAPISSSNYHNEIGNWFTGHWSAHNTRHTRTRQGGEEEPGPRRGLNVITLRDSWRGAHGGSSSHLVYCFGGVVTCGGGGGGTALLWFVARDLVSPRSVDTCHRLVKHSLIQERHCRTEGGLAAPLTLPTSTTRHSTTPARLPAASI